MPLPTSASPLVTADRAPVAPAAPNNSTCIDKEIPVGEGTGWPARSTISVMPAGAVHVADDANECTVTNIAEATVVRELKVPRLQRMTQHDAVTAIVIFEVPEPRQAKAALVHGAISASRSVGRAMRNLQSRFINAPAGLGQTRSSRSATRAEPMSRSHPLAG